MKLRREAATLKKKSFNEYDQERPYRHHLQHAFEMPAIPDGPG
jgi:hypothetical protein